MDATLPPTGRRAGALWVAATGAFLLLAAAAVFVAVSWDQLPDAAKLAIVGSLTGSFLLGGRALERSLPATGGVLFHLGAFLLPVDLAAVALRLEAGWRELLVAEGLLATAAFPALAVLSGSVVLRWAGIAAVPVLVAGIAALTPVPAPLLLAAAAGGALLATRHTEAGAWAAVAGLAPVAGVAGAAVVRANGWVGTGVLAELGLAGDQAAALAVVSGSVAGAVLATLAHRTRDLTMAALALLSVGASGAAAWQGAHLSDRATVLALPAVFLLLQLCAVVAARDPFWRRPVDNLAMLAEVPAAAVSAGTVAWLFLAAPFVEEGFDFMTDVPGWRPDPVAGVSLGLLAGAWLIAGLRRVTTVPSVAGGLRAAAAHPVAGPLAVAAAAAGLQVASASTLVTAAAMVAAAWALVAAGGAVGRVLLVPTALWLPAVTSGRPLVALPATLLAGAALVEAGVGIARRRGDGAGQLAATLLTGAATVAAVAAGAVAADALGTPAAMLAAVVGCWALAAAADRAGLTVGDAARLTMAVPAIAALVAAPEVAGILPAAAATLLLAADAIRHDRPATAAGAVVAAQITMAGGAHHAGLEVAEVGLTLCVAALVWAGLAVLAPARWRPALIAGALSGVAAGLPLAAGDPRMLADAVIVTGGLVAAAGLGTGRLPLAHAGGVIVTAGVAGHLSSMGVATSEAYLAPVCAHLLLAGVHARSESRSISSWVAYTPAVVLFGGAALVERLAGGSAVHALLAGLVGVTAVTAGGWLRLAGPLFAGTALLVAVTVVETLTTLAGLPTWAWLAAGGATLLGAGIALERTETSPVDAGRRVVEVIADRFE